MEAANFPQINLRIVIMKDVIVARERTAID